MIIKKYVAGTLKEATEKMKSELGEKALVLSTKIIEQFEDGNNKKLFEVMSGYEEEREEIEEILKQRNNISKARNNFIPGMKHEIESKSNFTKSLFQKTLNKNNGNSDELKDEIQIVIDALRTKDVNRDIIITVLNYLKKSKDFLTISNLDDYVITGLTSLIHTRNFSVEKRKSGRVISIVGPTGVGKTTCIAKLAAISKIIHNLDIGIISIDTYRLGAIDQLRIFTEISNVDMLVAYEPREMPKLVDKLKKKDLIFIDTTGRNQRNSTELNKMKEFFSAIKVDETYLALSLTSSVKHLYDAAEKFNIFNYDSFIFTKIDEAVTHGNLLNLLLRFQKPVIYLTNGQIIPDDILSAEPMYVANLIYKGNQEQ